MTRREERSWGLCVGAALVAVLSLSASAQFAAAPVQPPANVASNQHLREGMAAYRDGDFKKAIPALRAALDELKTDPGFETSLIWRALVDNLGMAYGIRGDLKNAKATFDYGVSEDPNYPMFHYNLACTFAEMRDRDAAIGALKQAFALKAHANPGEAMPNPARDDSFARFRKDKTFLAALEEIRRSGRRFPDRLDFTAPAAPWVVTIPAGEFEISQNRQSPDGKQSYFLISDEKTGITASILIEPTAKCADSASCRDLVRTSNLPRLTGAEKISSSEIGGVSVFEYFLPSFNGLAVQQQNLYAEFVRDGFWVDLHISKLRYSREDRKLFEALVRSVTFEPKQ